ncbi:hypothetical protein LOZ57_002077 [Ophidiomyces ophidiicola]|uniref:uncharacterized protein n=1 Tax=Ophidiomyces ophidiicola TaxID=1387563 RepID=UPI0020C4FBE0|nr:uncharacterized protein LOZ57_002077 [Ophidiomyces ophidiicola]KAI1950517.1 hypothetical protein LOZ57_002077 [Ophidiomyces ophidiicola]KAI2044910.1 hypothetical protein LOZ43_006234 [Ophidiomyces ophidiicola]KAI2081578.1 hypothetical protein LOZ36_006189 [Ophidiomyces ophidiicola]
MKSFVASLLSALSLGVVAPPRPADWRLDFGPFEATVETVHAALLTRKATCRSIVSAFLAQTETFNPRVNAILTLNPTALRTADALDIILRDKLAGRHEAELELSAVWRNASATASTMGLPPLFCIPTIVKDNVDTADMPTTGGSLTLSSLRPDRDAPVLTNLRKAGAILLAKTNMHELALEGISVSSLGGQTLNPYDLSRTPGGSSGGTGAGLAMGFGVLGVGTDTMNSIRSPASACGVVGMRPGLGMLDTDGVMPVSWSQDVVGPLARDVRDVVVMLGVMEGKGVDYTTEFGPEHQADFSGLNGMRLGVVETFFDRTSASSDPGVSAVNNVVESMLARLHAAEATLIPITNALLNSTVIHSTMDRQVYEFRQAMDAYLSYHHSTTSPDIPASLAALYSAGSQFLLLPNQRAQLTQSFYSSPQNMSYATRKALASEVRSAVHSIFSTYTLDALIYPHQTTLAVPVSSPSQRGRNGILASVTGFPAISLPAGYSSRTGGARAGVPVGVEVLGLPRSEKQLLELAGRIERVIGGEKRTPPVLWDTKRKNKRYFNVPVIAPNRKNIPKAYSLGVW